LVGTAEVGSAVHEQIKAAISAEIARLQRDATLTPCGERNGQPGLRRAEPLWLSLVLLALGDDVGEWMADLFR
jgi:hypothetical protein